MERLTILGGLSLGPMVSLKLDKLFGENANEHFSGKRILRLNQIFKNPLTPKQI